jgi:DNA repair protein RecO (recombination protein O)
MERFVERALVLSTVDFGDADRIVTLFTEERGKLTAFAAGARKSKRRFAGALEPGTLVKAQLVERHGSTFRLDSVDIERTFHGFRNDLSLISRALYALELTRELTREQEPYPQLFSLTVAYLDALDRHQAGPTSLVAFELDALASAGLMPRFDRCAICEGEVGAGAQFDAEHGGAVCAGCLGRVRSGRPVPLELVKALRGLQEGERTPLSPEHRRRAREVLNFFISHHLGKKIRSVEFLEQLGVD